MGRSFFLFYNSLEGFAGWLNHLLSSLGLLHIFGKGDFGRFRNFVLQTLFYCLSFLVSLRVELNRLSGSRSFQFILSISITMARTLAGFSVGLAVVLGDGEALEDLAGGKIDHFSFG